MRRTTLSCWFYIGLGAGVMGRVMRVVTAVRAEVCPVVGGTVGLFRFLFCGGAVVGLFVCRLVFGPRASFPFGEWAESGRARDSDSYFRGFCGIGKGLSG